MIVYKITNLITDKVYIGLTTRSISKRWEGHLDKAFYQNSDNYLHNSIRKYGKENFTIEEIDGANSLSELNYLEKHYICKFNSLAPNGYNLLNGGDVFKHHRNTIDKLRKKVSSKFSSILCVTNGIVYESISEASRKLNITRKSINDNVIGKTNTAHGLVFEFVDKDKKKESEERALKRKRNRLSKIKNRQRTVKCIETNEVFDSIKEASIALKISTSNIQSVLSGRQKKSKGYTFKYFT